ncbi:hypothetical protein EOL71_02390 [Candidatus Saccharibacteria bacterium]|nr:hypothetical protein [Candidatus Saccharibacteria bacterium]
MIGLISNPPYNMKWQHPPFAQLQPRFNDCELPPESNANYAFILTGFNYSDRSVFLLPYGVLTSMHENEQAVRKWLIDKNLVEAVITLPGKMFESTDIATCIMVLSKRKQSTDIVMIDMRNTYEVENREQNGQYGSSAHTGRTYVKKVNVFSDEQIEEVLETVERRKNKQGYSKCVSCQTVADNGYNLLPSHFLEIVVNENAHRTYEEILKDLNGTVANKNLLKLTINETIAKSLGLYEFGKLQAESRENGVQMSESMEQLFSKKIIKDDYISLTKKKGEIKFENKSKDELSHIFIMMLQMYKQHIVFLNNEENRYLVELRDALLPDLMSGKIKVDGLDND